MSTLTGAQVRHLKGLAQRLEPVLHIGKAGLSAEFLASAEAALNQHELVKIKFAQHKEEKKTLAPELAEKTGSQLIQRVGNVAVIFRQNADPARRRIVF